MTRIQNPVELVISCSFGKFITPFKALGVVAWADE
jgi:hypothetical protein